MGYKTQLSALGGAISLVGSMYMVGKTAVYQGKYSIFIIILIVDTGHKAIIFNKFTGLKEQSYREGWHLKMPWVERAIIYNVKAMPTTTESKTGTAGK